MRTRLITLALVALVALVVGCRSRSSTPVASRAVPQYTLMVNANGTITKPPNFLANNEIATYDSISAASNAAFILNEARYAKKAAGNAGVIFTNALGYLLTLGPLDTATSNSSPTIPNLHGNFLADDSVETNKFTPAARAMLGTGSGGTAGAVTNNETRAITVSGAWTFNGGLTAPGLAGFNIVVSGSTSNDTPVAVYTNAVTEGRTYLIQLMVVAGGVGSQTNSYEDFILTRISYASNDVVRVVSTNSFSLIAAAAGHDPVTLAGQNYLSLAGQQITAAAVNLDTHTTGSLPMSKLADTNLIAFVSQLAVLQYGSSILTNLSGLSGTNLLAFASQIAALQYGSSILTNLSGLANTNLLAFVSQLADYLALAGTNAFAAGITNLSKTYTDARQAATVTNRLYIPAGAFRPGATVANSAAWGTNTSGGVALDTWDFDGTNSETNLCSFVLRSWNLSPLSAQVYYGSAASSAGGVVWQIEFTSMGSNEAVNATWSSPTKVTNTWAGTADRMNTTAAMTNAPGGDPAVGDLLVLRLSRLPADDGDTMTGDAKMMGVLLTYLGTNSVTAP